MSDFYALRWLLVDAFSRACPIPPTNCTECGWPYGGTGKYVCLCGKRSGETG